MKDIFFLDFLEFRTWAIFPRLSPSFDKGFLPRSFALVLARLSLFREELRDFRKNRPSGEARDSKENNPIVGLRTGNSNNWTPIVGLQ